jgi:Fe-S-cluster containining protein
MQNGIYNFIEGLKKKDLSKYCLNGCERNQCCTDLNRFTLILDKQQIALLYGNKIREEHPEQSKTRNGQERLLRSKINQLISEEVLFKRSDGLFWYRGPMCEGYDRETRKCKVHQHYKRPDDCAAFPLFFEKKKVIMDGRCNFIKLNWEEIFSRLEGDYHQAYSTIEIHFNGLSGKEAENHVLPADTETVRNILAAKKHIIV